jgi:diaminobutyrate-2-oxoglutarate transaminase
LVVNMTALQDVGIDDLGLDTAGIAPFSAHESEVRLYCRKFPAVFTRAKSARLYAEDGRSFIDFFAGAGSLNYGHNNDRIKARLLDYLTDDGIMHGLDLHTGAKRDFLVALQDTVLRPRGLDYKVLFSAPTGADAVEAALKIVRRATGRTGVVAFTGGFHGMTVGALSVTGSRTARAAAGVPLGGATFVPYEDGPDGPYDAIEFLRRTWRDASGGTGLPAAVIVEAVQMEGGVYAASAGWLRDLRALTQAFGVLLICDDIQAGCGRTGSFFSFEHAGITPDVVTLSKSIGGCGLPLAVVLLRPELDLWRPGEHTGTFRGNQLAFVAATAALDLWHDGSFTAGLRASGTRLQAAGRQLAQDEDAVVARGRGMVLGLDTAAAGGPARAKAIQRCCFDHGLVLELCGRDDSVVKLLPPLTIETDELNRGISVVRDAFAATRLGAPSPAQAAWGRA